MSERSERTERDSEQVVLLCPDGTPSGVADKADVHAEVTPYHLAFSCYVFDSAGKLLVTRRALSKLTWPGVWTNSCCGHPGPGEDPRAAVVRRLETELGLSVEALELALADFSYRASFAGIEENELCPVFLARTDADPFLDPTEVAEAQWMPWPQFVALATAPESTISPWAQAQVRELEAGDLVQSYLGSR
ncbi:MAG: isopentenyl-diphosphate Delta-isomerase [Sporichthyaceae bacterium]